MKRAIMFGMLMGLLLGVKAQSVEDHVSWEYSVQKKKNGKYKVNFFARIGDSYHIYVPITTLTPPLDNGALPTTFSFEPDSAITINGELEMVGNIQNGVDPQFFVGNVRYYTEKVLFVQNIIVKDGAPHKLKGTIEYMCTNSVECLRPKKHEFSIDLK